MAIYNTKYILSSTTSGKNGLLDLRLKAGTLSLNEQNATITGSANVDFVYASAGMSVDFTASGAGADMLFLDGAIGDYKAYVSGSILTLTRGASTYKLSTAEATDKVVFTNGAATVAQFVAGITASSAATAAALNTSLSGFDTATNSLGAPQLSNVDSVNRVSLQSAGTVTATANPAKLIVSGSAGVDTVYVKAGGTADLTGLGGSMDKIYFTGKWADYSKTVKGSTLTFSRSINGVTESVVVAAGAGVLNDRLIFADGNVASGTAAGKANLNSLSLTGAGGVIGLAAEKTPLATLADSAITAISADTNITTDFITKASGQTLSGTYTGMLNAGDKIQVKVNGAWVDATTTTPSLTGGTFTVANVTLTEGTKAYDVQVLGADGSTKAGAGKSITLDTGVPAVSLAVQAPEDALVNAKEASIHLQATPSANAKTGDVIVLKTAAGATLGTATVGADATAPITFTVFRGQLAEGLNNITATISDAAGNNASSSALQVTVDTQIATPTISLAAAPSGGGNWSSATINDQYLNPSENQVVVTVQGTGGKNLMAGDTVQLTKDGANLVTAGNTAAYTHTVTLSEAAANTVYFTVAKADLGSADGSYVLAAKVSDAAGNSATTTNTQAVVLDSLIAEPRIALAPTKSDGSAWADAVINDKYINASEDQVTVTVTGTNTKPLKAGDSVQLLRDGTAIGTAHTVTDLEAASNTVYFNVSKAADLLNTDGTYQLSAKVSDAASNTATTVNAQEVVLDTTPAKIVSMGATTPDGSYKAGDSIQLTLTVDEAMPLDATLAVTLETGVTDHTITFSRDASNPKLFKGTYVVQPGDTSLDLSVNAVTAVNAKDAAGNSLDTALPADTTKTLSGSKDLVIDTTPPTIVDIQSPKADGHYKAGTSIELTLSVNEAMPSDASLSVTLETGAADRVVTFYRDPGDAKLFKGTYVVQPGDTSPDLSVNAVTSVNAKDAAGNLLDFTLPTATHSLEGSKALVIDTTAPETTLSVSAVDGSLQALNPGTLGDDVVTQNESFIWLKIADSGKNSFQAGDTVTLQHTQNGAMVDLIDPATDAAYTATAVTVATGTYIKVDSSVLAEGINTLQVTASDLAGNTAQSNTLSVHKASALTFTNEAMTSGAAINIEVTSQIVLKANYSLSSAAVNKNITIVNDAAANGYEGEAVQHSFTFAANDSRYVSISGDTITIKPPFDFDFGNSYHVEIDAGAFVATVGSSAVPISSGAVTSANNLNFSTVTVGPDLASAVQGQHFAANGTLVDGKKWFSIDNTGTSTAPVDLDLSGANYAMVFKDLSTSVGIDPAYDGVGVGGLGFNLNVFNFAAGDLIYADDQFNNKIQLNNHQFTDIRDDGASLVVQFNPQDASTTEPGILTIAKDANTVDSVRDQVAISNTQHTIQGLAIARVTDAAGATTSTDFIIGAAEDLYVKVSASNYKAGDTVQLVYTDANGVAQNIGASALLSAGDASKGFVTLHLSASDMQGFIQWDTNPGYALNSLYAKVNNGYVTNSANLGGIDLLRYDTQAAKPTLAVDLSTDPAQDALLLSSETSITLAVNGSYGMQLGDQLVLQKWNSSTAAWADTALSPITVSDTVLGLGQAVFTASKDTDVGATSGDYYFRVKSTDTVGNVAYSATDTTGALKVSIAQYVSLSGNVGAGSILAGNDLVVTAYDRNGKVLGTDTTVDATTGAYSITVLANVGPVLLKVTSTGANSDYRDEATTLATNLAGSTLMAAGTVAGSNLSVNINPLTDLAARALTTGSGSAAQLASSTSADTVAAANLAISKAYVDPASTSGITALTPVYAVDTAGASTLDSANRVGLVLAALSAKAQTAGSIDAAQADVAAGITWAAGNASATLASNALQTLATAQLVETAKLNTGAAASGANLSATGLVALAPAAASLTDAQKTAVLQAIIDSPTASMATPAQLQALVATHLALAKIEAYNNGDGTTPPAPTLADYAAAGITGVTASNLAAVNAQVLASNTGGADSAAKVLALVSAGDAALAKIEAYNNGNGTTPPALTLADYKAAGITGVTADNLAAVNAKVLAAAPGGATTVDGILALATSGTSAQLAALDKIATYAAANTNAAPTLNDYTLAGVTGVTADNLAAVNAQVDAAAQTGADQLSEVQALVTAANSALAKVEAYNNGNGTTPAALGLADYAAAGITGVTADNLAAVNAKVLAAATGGADTVGEIQALVTAANSALATIEAYNNGNGSSPAALGLADYAAAGITGVTADNLAAVNAKVLAAATGGADTVGEIQALVTQGTADQAAALAKIALYADANTNAAPTVNDYLLAGVTGVNASNLNQVNYNVDLAAKTGANTVALVQGLVNTADLTAPTGTLNAKALSSDAAYQTITSNVIDGAVTNNGDTVLVKSTEVGKAYLVKSGNTPTTVTALEALADNQWNSVAITTVNTDTALSTTGLAAGSYKLYVADAAGNLSAAGATAVNVIDGYTVFSDASATTAMGNLIAKATVDGGNIYYHWDISGDGTPGSDYPTHDWLDPKFNKDVNGNVNPAGATADTTDTYRYGTLYTASGTALKVALPTLGSAAVGGNISGTAVGDSTTPANGSNAVNSTYNDLSAIWDAYNGTGAGVTNVSGNPPGWGNTYYWSATGTGTGTHAAPYLPSGSNGVGAGDTNTAAVALQLLDTAGIALKTLAVSSSATHQGNTTYLPGETITFKASFGDVVNVTNTGGNPYINILVGSSTQKAFYTSGTGSKDLTFSYTVANGDNDANGISVAAGDIVLNGGTISGAAGNYVALSYSAVADNASHLVDTPPTGTLNTKALSSDAAYQTITSNVIDGAVTNNGDTVLVKSTEVGKAYLVKSGNTPTSVGGLEALADDQWNSVAITTANTDTALSTTGLAAGSYKLYVADAAGNLSAASTTSVNVIDGITVFSDASATTAMGNLIAKVTVDGGNNYYLWDISGDGTSAGLDTVTHDWLDPKFNKDVNGNANPAGASADTTDTYRYGTLYTASGTALKVALPTLGSAAVSGNISGTAVGDSTTPANGSNAVNSAYNDLSAIWDAYNGTGVGVTSVSANLPNWINNTYYWSATSTGAGSHAAVLMSAGANGVGSGDTYTGTVALQVL